MSRILVLTTIEWQQIYPIWSEIWLIIIVISCSISAKLQAIEMHLNCEQIRIAAFIASIKNVVAPFELSGFQYILVAEFIP